MFLESNLSQFLLADYFYSGDRFDHIYTLYLWILKKEETFVPFFSFKSFLSQFFKLTSNPRGLLDT